MTFSETTFEAPMTAAENSDQPLLNAARGLSWKSDIVGAAAEVMPNDGCCEPGGDGEGALPKPWYLPPWEGGRLSGRDAFNCPIDAKNASLAVF